MCYAFTICYKTGINYFEFIFENPRVAKETKQKYK